MRGRDVLLPRRDAVTGDQAMAAWNHNAPVKIQGRTYIFSVNQGSVFDDALGCGRTRFRHPQRGLLLSRKMTKSPFRNRR